MSQYALGLKYLYLFMYLTVKILLLVRLLLAQVVGAPLPLKNMQKIGARGAGRYLC